MRRIKLQTVVIAMMLMTITSMSFAQRNSRTRSGYGNPTTTQSGYGTPANRDTTKPRNTTTSGYGNTTQSGYGNTGNTRTNTPQPGDTSIKYQTVKNTSGGLLDSTKMSLRNDAVIERNLVKERMPLEYEHIREDDAVYRVRVWRVIDTREKLNQPFRYAATEDNGNQRFISILLKAIKEDSVMAFNSDDDRFTTPITPEQAINSFGGGFDTVPSYDMEGNIASYQVRDKTIDPDSIYMFRIKEEWVFDKEASRMFVRILGIAPVYQFKLSTGQNAGEKTAFWVYYPDLRPILSKFEVYNAKNYGARMTWEELFESRMFSSYIIQSTIDNPRNLPLSGYIQDKLFRLLEGENIKEKIFSYEQNLWSY
jgi:gliding motility associated protien GldN